MIGFSRSLYSHKNFFDVVRNNTKYLELIKRRSKVQETNMTCEQALNLTNEKYFPKNISQ